MSVSQRSSYVLSARTAYCGMYAACGQRVAEAEHPLVRGREVGRVWYAVETYEVDPALDAVQKPAKLPDMARRVVQPLHDYILERHAALVREVVSAQYVRYLAYRPRLLDGHDLRPLFRKGVVQRHGQIDARFVEQPFEIRGHAGRRDRNARGRPPHAPLRCQRIERAQHLLDVVERLAHAHVHDVGKSVALGQRDYLVEYVRGGERVLQPLTPRGAEAAPHAAPRLRRYAERGAVAVGYVGRLDVRSFERAVEIFARAVGRYAYPLGCSESGRAALGQQCARGRRQVGHPVERIDEAAVEPARRLSGREARHRHLRTQCSELVEAHSVENMFRAFQTPSDLTTCKIS